MEIRRLGLEADGSPVEAELTSSVQGRAADAARRASPMEDTADRWEERNPRAAAAAAVEQGAVPSSLSSSLRRSASNASLSSSSSSLRRSASNASLSSPSPSPRRSVSNASLSGFSPSRRRSASNLSLSSDSTEASSVDAVATDATLAIGNIYRSGLNRAIVLAETEGSELAALRGFRDLARTFIGQGWDAITCDAVLRPLSPIHRMDVLTALMRADGRGDVSIARCPGGGVYQWAVAVCTETHARSFDAHTRQGAISLLRSTISLIEEAEVSNLADHRRGVSRVKRRLMSHVRTLMSGGTCRESLCTLALTPR